MRSSSKQNENIKLSDIPEVTGIRHQSFITWSISLGEAKAGNLKLDFMAKSIGIHFLGFKDIFRCYRDTKS